MGAVEIPQGLKAASQRLLEVHPSAQAVVLFGSRARGQERAWSDWDLAVITNGKGAVAEPLDDAATSVFDGLPMQVQCLEVSMTKLERGCNRAGDIAREVVRDGVLVTGNWSRPPRTTHTAEVTMNKESYNAKINATMTALETLPTLLKKIKHEKSDLTNTTNINGFIKSTADAAECLAKAKLVRLRLDFPFTHSLEKLAELADAQGLSELADEFRSINGHSAKDHVAQYEGTPLSERYCANAMTRLAGILAILPDEIELARHDGVLDCSGDLEQYQKEWRELIRHLAGSLASVNWPTDGFKGSPKELSAIHALKRLAPDAVAACDECARKIDTAQSEMAP